MFDPRQYVIIAGDRHMELTRDNYEYLEKLVKASGFDIGTVISGACGIDYDDPGKDRAAAQGGDALGEQYAHANGLSLRRVYATWKRMGPAAGPIRNRAMAKMADALITLPGGRGTRDMRRSARRAGIPMFPPWGSLTGERV